MDVRQLEIKSYDGPGFQPQVFFGAWRVAILNHQPTQERGLVPFVERHLETDEVFVLLAGPATLLMGGAGDAPLPLEEVLLEAGKTYNVPQNVWHAIITEPDSKLLIVENAVTDQSNSEYCDL